MLHMIAVLLFVGRVTPEITRQQWSCGVTDAIADKLFKLFEGKCASYKPHVNFCCASHKDCYKLQLGEHYCNVRLCLCLEKIISEKEKKDDCDYPIYRSCTEARMHGEQLYQSYNTTEEGCSVAGGISDACDINYHECLKKQGKDDCDKYLVNCKTCATQQCDVKLKKDEERVKTKKKKNVNNIWNPVALLVFCSVYFLRLL